MPPSLGVQPPAPEQEIPPAQSQGQMSLWLTQPFFPLTAPELVPWSQTRKYFILHHITYHSTALDPQARRTAGFWVGDRTPTVSWFPLPVQQSSSCPCLERETFMGCCRQAATPARTGEFCKCSTCTNFVWLYSQLFSVKNGPVLVY